MSRFSSDRHAASWAKVCPGNDESAGKRRSGKNGKATPTCAPRWSGLTKRLVSQLQGLGHAVTP